VKRYSLLLLLAALSGCARSERSPLTRAADYLWNQQAGDGGWHSRTYGLLRSGQSLTPFVLDALLQVPEEVYPLPAGKVDRALAFIHARTRKGALGLAQPDVPDYPNYATALAISALARAGRTGDGGHMERMVAYLLAQQFTEQNGWKPQDPAYGAWGMGGQRRTPPDTGHVDLSMTRHVLEALRAAGMPAADPLYGRARVFVERCQNFDPAHPNDLDGGFFFSTTEHDTNKAGHDGKRFRSYGTTTADGILALLATGARADHPRVVAARRWLTLAMRTSAGRAASRFTTPRQRHSRCEPWTPTRALALSLP
jgi:squalene-hopene/tetraprenyl-beta-curcumene cyclase